jgi:hypothetical protein
MRSARRVKNSTVERPLTWSLTGFFMSIAGSTLPSGGV